MNDLMPLLRTENICCQKLLTKVDSFESTDTNAEFFSNKKDVRCFIFLK